MDIIRPEQGHQPYGFFCIEGVIGAGKSTLSRIFAERLDARLVLEQAEENPFLSQFYKNRRLFAFQTQIWYSVLRYRQLSEALAQHDLFHTTTVTDYMFEKDQIFATVNLDENELSLYNTIVAALKKKVARPDFVIYLQASTDVLMRRIEKRGRQYEFNMDRSYIEILNEAYNHFFFHYTDTPLLIINTNDIDFVENSDDLEEIFVQLQRCRSGTNYITPVGNHTRTQIALAQKQLGRDTPP